ncbi:MAG: hypothetical protein R2788_12095 [Saprospiraceae bacterium]
MRTASHDGVGLWHHSHWALPHQTCSIGYGLAALITFIGFGISTPGVLAVLGIGVIVYLILSKTIACCWWASSRLASLFIFKIHPCVAGRGAGAPDADSL